MAKNLEDVRLMVRSFLDEPIAADWTDLELNALINARYHQLYSAVIDVYEEYAQLKVATTDLVPNQQEYETQLDFLKMRRIEVKYADSEENRSRAYPTTMDAVRRSLDGTSDGVAVVRRPNYYLRGNIVGLMPVPTEEVIDGMKSWYYATVPDMVADSDLLTLPYVDRDWLLIAYGATADALDFGQQEPQSSDKMEKKWRAGVLLMQQALEDRVSDEYKGVIDVTGDGLNFSESNY